ncbi:MAG: PAS domain-containing protein [Alphaproteobacteria bacterium]
MAELTKASEIRTQSLITLTSWRTGAWVAAVFLYLLSCAFVAAPAHALNAKSIAPDQDRIDFSLMSEIYIDRGDHLSIETAAGSDNVAGRMSIAAKTPGTNPTWMVFALNNPTDQTITLWLMAPRYNLPGSRMIWPDLDAPRVANVTVSMGFKPERIENDFADVYKLVLEPGATITYIVELASVTTPRLYLASPSNFAKRALDITLFNGILLGITVVLALYLTAIFGANHNSIFPAAAVFAWGVVAYLCVDFGFWHKLFQLNPENNAVYRAATEAAVAAGALIFLFVFLRLRHWYKSLTWGFVGWIVMQVSLIGVALLYPQEASGLARLSYVPLAAVGSVLILFLAFRGQERSLSLLPTWMLFLVWMFGVAVTILGKMSGEVVVSSLNAGLVLIVALLSFTVTQYAFNSGETIYGEDAGHLQLQVLALEASGASVWEWDIRRDDVFVGPDVDASLGYAPGTLRGKAEDWLQHLHASDRERMRLMLAAVREQQSGEVTCEFRLRRADGTYLWYELRAQAVTSRQSKQLRCAGLMRDITSQKRSQESLLHNAIYDSLTGLPNRELFLDRIQCAIASVQDENSKPTILYLDIDTFKTLNRTADITVSDSMLLSVSFWRNVCVVRCAPQ